MIQIKQNRTQKGMWIDEECQGVCDLDGNPLSPYMTYIAKHIDGMDKWTRGLFLGGGFFILPRYFQEKKGQAVVFEKNIEVINETDTWFDISKLTVHNSDASDLHKFTERKPFDLILLDCYPRTPELYCADYYDTCRHFLYLTGTLIVNFCSTDQKEIDEQSQNLKTVFKSIKLKIFYKDKEMTEPVQSVFLCTNYK